MPVRLFFWLFMAVVGLSVSGCSLDEDDPTADWSAEEFYTQAHAALKDYKYATAIRYFETLESRFPFGGYATQAQMDVAYTYYRYDEPDSALAAADRFIKLHPRHPNVDYLYYLKGLTNFSRGQTLMDSFYERDTAEYDQQNRLEAFNDFATLVRLFPDSRYSADAKKRMIFLRNSMAASEIRIAEHNVQRQAWVGALNRTKNVLEQYQGSESVQRALEIQIEAYEALNLPEQAELSRRLLILNYGSETTAPES